MSVTDTQDIDELIERHYRSENRIMRRCHARDLLNQIRAYCNYTDTQMDIKLEYFDRAVKTYFTTVLGNDV